MAFENKKEKIEDLRNRIAQALRTEKSNVHKIKYIEMNKNKTSLLQPNNHIIWGRRGSGKTTLLLISFYETYHKKKLPVFIDAKVYKNHTYPDLLIKILITLFEDIDKVLKNGLSGFFRRKIFTKEIKELERLIKIHEDITKIEREEQTSNASQVGADISANKSGLSASSKKETAVKQSYSYFDNKIQYLEKKMSEYQKLISKSLKKSNREELLVLIDDYYYLRMNDQPYIVDYLHRLFYDTNGWIKIASNRYSSKLYERTASGERIGLTEGDDCLPIDLDYTLVKFKDTERFLLQIIKNHAKTVGINNIEEWFSPNAFTRLVWCSGGVPRDFLNLMIIILNQLEENKKIGVYLINDSTKDYFESKLSDIGSEYEQATQIKELFDKLFYLCVEKHKYTGFLVENKTNSLHEQKAFKDLMDHRLIHLVEKNISAKAYSGKRFDGYILNVGSYAQLLRLKDNKPHEINIIKDPKRPIDSEIRSKAPAITKKDVDELHIEKIGEEKPIIKIPKEKSKAKTRAKPKEQIVTTNSLLKWMK